MKNLQTNIGNYIENCIWLIIGAVLIPYFYSISGNLIIGEWHSPIFFIREAIEKEEYIYAFQFAIPVFMGFMCRIILLVEMIKFVIRILKKMIMPNLR